jgi:hypothetical protein
MPAKPAWLGRLDEILRELEALPCPGLTRGAVEFLLGVGPRRAQQIMAPCVTEQIGTSLVADRRLLIDHLRALAAGESGHYESQRRRKLATTLDHLRSAWLEQPRVLVAAPAAIVNQRFEDLPAGIELEPGRIAVRFATPAEALEKLLALAMAIGKDRPRFEAITAVSTESGKT